MSLQTTLVKAYSLNQTSCQSPQFQICTVTPVSQCHVLTYRQSRDRRLVYWFKYKYDLWAKSRKRQTVLSACVL